MIVPWVRAIGTSCTDDVRNIGRLETRFVKGFATCSYRKRDSIFKEYSAKFGDGGRAIHVCHGMVDGTNCGAGFDAGEVIDCAYFFHSAKICVSTEHCD